MSGESVYCKPHMSVFGFSPPSVIAIWAASKGVFVRVGFIVIVMVIISDVFFFFFSSRRRHTRLQGDWSSDVCSSDLPFVLGSWPYFLFDDHLLRLRVQVIEFLGPSRSFVGQFEDVQAFGDVALVDEDRKSVV